MTVRLRACADQWRSISSVPDIDAAALIRRDAIDILVDLSGHTGGNRLTMFALRPAPVQVSWLGYFGTTGLSSIDYILADGFVVPEGEQKYFTEAVWHLPGSYLCYAPHDFDVRVALPPALNDGNVTFGCFNNRAKITANTVSIWASILRRLDGSRLFLKNKSLADTVVGRNAGRRVRCPWDCSGPADLGGTLTIGRGVGSLQSSRYCPRPVPFWRRHDYSPDHLDGRACGDAARRSLGWPNEREHSFSCWVARVGCGKRNRICRDCAAARYGSTRIGKEAVDLAFACRKLALLQRSWVARQLEAAFRGMWNAWCRRQKE